MFTGCVRYTNSHFRGLEMQKRNRRAAFTFLLALATLFSSTLLHADVTGAILGVVHDRSQAVVAGAHVTVTNVQTNFTQETTSAADGSYRFLALPAGNYKVTASSAGFSQFTATDIVLSVNDQLHIDITLQVGNVQQEISVSANTVQVESESTQLGDVIDSKKMLSLPLNGRSYIDLLGLQAGVVPVTSGSMQQDRPVSGNLSSGNLSVNGQRETANAFLVNGGDVSEGRNLGAGLIPNIDSIEEFRLITNSFDAEYGKFSGSVMNAITKSGTNGLHGTVFEFLRNDKLDGRNYFDPARSELRRNQFGYAVGGPFWKNRLFWFTDYQGTRQVVGASTGLVQVPNVDQRNGTFSPSDFLDSDGNPLTGGVNGAFWAQTLSTRLGYAVTDGEPYYMQGCTANSQCVFPNGIIPSNGFAAPAVGILPYIPLPNVAGSGDTFSDNSQKNSVTDNKFGQRVDFINQKTGTWSFYYHLDNSTVVNALNASVPGFSSITPTRAQQFVMSNTKTFGPTAVNQVRASFFRTATVTDKPQTSFAQLSDLGFITGAGTLGINPSGPAGFPQTVPPEYFNNFSLGVNTLTTFQPNNTYQISDSFSKVVGPHTLKFGGEFRYLQINERNTCAPNGDFTFNGSETGSDFADFLIGAPVNYNQCSQQFLDSRSRYGGAYIQDTYKWKPNITLNLGLRWETSMPWYDTQGKIETIVPGLQSTQFPTAPKGWVVPGDPGIPSTLAPTRYNNFGPRVGIAYSPGFNDGLLGKIFGGPGKSSIRAAWGMYYTSIEDLNLFYEVGDAPFGLYWVSPEPTMFDEPFRTRSSGASQTQRFPFKFPTPGSPDNANLDYSIYLPISFSPGFDIHNRLPYAEHYDFSIQRELSRNTVLTLAYVGTQGHRLISQYDAVPGNPALCLQLRAEGATPFCDSFGENTTYTLPSGAQVFGTRDSNGLNSVFTAPPNFGDNNSFTVNIANSNYNAAQVTLERKAADLTFLAAYTYSKAIDNSSGFGQWVNFSNPRLTRSLSSFDVTHNFVFSYNWAIPFDRAFAGAPKRLTQGWNWSGIVRFTGGLPVPISQNGDDVSLFGSANTDEPNVVGKVHIQDPRNPDHTFFNRDAFVSGPVGAFGNSSRQFFHGPGINNFDISLMKRTAITESTAFEIRVEFFNIFNHTQFRNPDGNFSIFGDQMGVVTSARDARIGQLGAKFYF
jgi:hypothetical protein